MLSTMSQLIGNMNSLRKREGKRPLTQHQIATVHKHVEMREEFGRVTCLPLEEAFPESFAEEVPA